MIFPTHLLNFWPFNKVARFELQFSMRIVNNPLFHIFKFLRLSDRINHNEHEVL